MMRIHVKLKFNARDYTDGPHVLGTTQSSQNWPFYLLGTDSPSKIGQHFIYPEMRPPAHIVRVSSKYASMLDHLGHGHDFSEFRFVWNGERSSIRVFHHSLYDVSGNILLMLTFNDMSMWEESRERQSVYQDDWGRFKLFISNELITQPEYGNFWKRLYKEYVLQFHVNGVPVEYLDSRAIKERVFANNAIPKLGSLTEYSEYLEKRVPVFLKSYIQEEIEARSHYMPPLPVF